MGLTTYNLACALHETGDLKGALRLMVRAHAIFEADAGAQHPRTKLAAQACREFQEALVPIPACAPCPAPCFGFLTLSSDILRAVFGFLPPGSRSTT